MPSPLFMNRETLLPALKDGRISIETIDDKGRRMLRKAIEFGFLDQQQTDPRPFISPAPPKSGKARVE
jgi:beta-glucosidase